MIRKFLILFIIGTISTAGFSQSITILSATLKKAKEQTNITISLVGSINVSFEINNPTKDTLYLFPRLVEPFLKIKPIYIFQEQPGIAKHSKDCIALFYDDPRPYSAGYRKFDHDKDIVRVAPKSKKKFNFNNTVTEGFCSDYGKKIEVTMIYNQSLSDFNIASSENKIKENEVAYKIVAESKSTYEQDSVLKKETELLRKLEQTMYALKRENEDLTTHIADFKYIQSLPFYTKEIRSNTVLVNE